MACETYTDCDNKELSPDDMLRLLIRTDSNGCPALAIIPGLALDTTCDTNITCTNSNLSWKDLFFLIVGIDENGCPAIRTVE